MTENQFSNSNLTQKFPGAIIPSSDFRFGAEKNLKVPTEISPAKYSDEITYQQYPQRALVTTCFTR